MVRTLTWLALDDLTDSINACMPNANRSNIYRTLVHFDINKVPQERKQQASIFKEYEPGYLHIDVTYLPKLAGKRQYLFVAIDRATRMLYFEIYNNKTAAISKSVQGRLMRLLKYWYNLKPDLFIREPDMFRSMVFEGKEQCGKT